MYGGTPKTPAFAANNVCVDEEHRIALTLILSAASRVVVLGPSEIRVILTTMF
jgi:hypothetical protein